MSPKTPGGRVFLVFFALFGMGLTAFVLSKAAETVPSLSTYDYDGCY